MEIQKRALYNSLRMNWLIDPTLNVEAWQVENYREMSLPLMFDKLSEFGMDFAKDTFAIFAEDFDTPEELTDELLGHETFDAQEEDHIYLLLFELWRRLETDKPCLSVFCNELDHQIFLYDHKQTQNAEDIEDAVSNLKVILDESTDSGANPLEVLNSVNEGCANHIETFLYDFITDQIDNENYSYASELLDNFIDYVPDDKWFDFLRVRTMSRTDPEGANILIQQLAEEAGDGDDLQFNLEVLSEMAQEGEQDTFTLLVKKSVKLLSHEEDFQDLLTVCIDYYCCQDEEVKEMKLQEVLNNRSQKDLSATFNKDDQDISKILSILT